MVHPVIRKLVAGQIKSSDEVLAILKRYKRVFREEYGVTKLGLFGPILARKTEPNESIDILVQFKGPTTFKGLIGAKLRLEELLGCHVVLSTKASLGDDLRAKIVKGALYA